MEFGILELESGREMHGWLLWWKPDSFKGHGPSKSNSSTDLLPFRFSPAGLSPCQLDSLTCWRFLKEMNVAYITVKMLCSWTTVTVCVSVCVGDIFAELLRCASFAGVASVPKIYSYHKSVYWRNFNRTSWREKLPHVSITPNFPSGSSHEIVGDYVER